MSAPPGAPYVTQDPLSDPGPISTILLFQLTSCSLLLCGAGRAVIAEHFRAPKLVVVVVSGLGYSTLE
jgi:hypothetical protein